MSFYFTNFNKYCLGFEVFTAVGYNSAWSVESNRSFRGTSPLTSGSRISRTRISVKLGGRTAKIVVIIQSISVRWTERVACMIFRKQKIAKKHQEKISLVINRSRVKDNFKKYFAEIKHEFKGWTNWLTTQSNDVLL